LSVMYVFPSSLFLSPPPWLFLPSILSAFLACPFCFLLSHVRVVLDYMLTDSHIKMRFSAVIKSFHRITTSTSPRAEKVEVEVVRVAQVTEKVSQ
jgi:hypothetical protein